MSRFLFLSLTLPTLGHALALGAAQPSAATRCGPIRMAGMTVATAKQAFEKEMQGGGEWPQTLSMPLQAFVNDMITSTTFATASANYKYTRVTAVGFEKLCETFLVQCTPELKAKIKRSLCAALQFDPDQVQKSPSSDATTRNYFTLLEPIHMTIAFPLTIACLRLSFPLRVAHSGAT